MPKGIAPRVAMGETLAELAESDPKIVVLDADFFNCSIVQPFKDKYPERFVEVGIAEQNMMSMAAGLATTGLKPYASTVAVFCSRRACDQVTTSIALQNTNVKILAAYVGLFAGKNGASHQALEDIAIMRAIPRMTVVQPADSIEMRALLKFSAQYEGPMYIRTARDAGPIYTPENYQFELGKSFQIKDGKDITLMAYGEMLEEALAVADIMESKNFSARVINMSSLKPVDEKAIIKAAKETGCIVTFDNHNIIGGLGSAVCETVSENCPVPVKRIGMKDVFGKSGDNDEMKKYFSLRAEDIEKEISAFLKKTVPAKKY